MTCKEMMTPDPSCCVPGDSVAMAAQIMKRNDVGPVPVVSDQHEKRLVGIVTDRDLTLKVLAEGRDPHTTRVRRGDEHESHFLPQGPRALIALCNSWRITKSGACPLSMRTIA